MKKIILFATAAISLTACRNDENDNSSSIVGTWKETKYVIYDGKTNQVLKTTNLDACESKSTLDFTNDGKFKWHTYQSYNSTCTDLGIEGGTYNYNQANKKLSVIWSDDPTTYTVDVLKLTSTELEFTDDDWDYNGDGVKDKHTKVFTRIK